MKTLDTDRLILRPWHKNDAAMLYTICLDPELRKSGVRFYSNVADCLDSIRQWNDKNEMLAVVRKEDNLLIGLAGLGDMNRYKGYKELEYAIADNYRGHGYGTEAVKSIIMHAFRDLNADVIAAWVRSHNKACVRVLEKCSLKYEGTLRKHARDKSDTLCYSILREEWEARY